MWIRCLHCLVVKILRFETVYRCCNVCRRMRGFRLPSIKGGMWSWAGTWAEYAGRRVRAWGRQGSACSSKSKMRSIEVNVQRSGRGLKKKRKRRLLLREMRFVSAFMRCVHDCIVSLNALGQEPMDYCEGLVPKLFEDTPLKARYKVTALSTLGPFGGFGVVESKFWIRTEAISLLTIFLCIDTFLIFYRKRWKVYARE